MNYIIKKFAANKHWIKHYELLVKTKLGYETVTSFHPMSGDKPMIFDSNESAENHFKSISQEDNHEILAINGKRIVYFPAQNGWIEHYEVFEKNWFKWEPVITWHPQSGDKPKMFDTWNDAKDYIRNELKTSENKHIKIKF